MRTCRQLFSVILLLAMIGPAPFASAQAPSASPLRELARKIVLHAQTRSAISLTVRNLTNISAIDFAAAQREIESQLRSLNVRLVKPEQAVETVRVTLTNTPSGALWVAEVEHAGSREVAMVAAGRMESTLRRVTGSVSVRRTLVWQQPEPMLDIAAISGSGHGLLILEPNQIVFRPSPDSPTTEFEIPHSRPWPRDMRGHLLLTANNGFEAQLPGVKCSGNWQALSATICVESDDPWILGSIRAFYNSSRNYFTGMLLPAIPGETKIPPFYTVAEIPQSGAKSYAFNGVDGRTRFITASGENLVAVGGWGSDIAAAKAECGTGNYILTTRVSESDHPDSIQAFELVNREPVEASAPTEVPGPVVSLGAGWDQSTATAIVQNIKNSEYEAYNLSISCGR